MSRFAHYGIAATEQALMDAGWKPTEEADLEATVGLDQLTACGVKLMLLGCLLRIRDRKSRRDVQYIQRI